MMQITVSDSLIVEYDEEQWRLIRVSHLGERNWIVAVEAGGSLRYSSFFATTRVLPDEGEISTDDIDEVILGWSYQTDAWQLSLAYPPICRRRGRVPAVKRCVLSTLSVRFMCRTRKMSGWRWREYWATSPL